MKQTIIIFAIVLSIFVTGCSDISGSGIADFGTTQADQDVLEHFKDKYGDITKSGTPRIIGSLVTTNIEENLPVDKVLKYSNSVDTFYLWFVYDNFKENDAIEIKWTYNEKNKVIQTSNTKTGDDFGRGSFSLEKPSNLVDNKWPLGEYTITISGNDIIETVEFSVIEGKTITTNLPWGEAVETKKADLGNIPDTKTYDKLYSNNNIGGCSYTDKSTFEIPVKAYVSKIRMWYHWAEGETQLPFTLKQDGKEIISGVLMREDCDPYQTSWCEGNYYPKSNFEAGNYELKVETAKLCQNSQSKGNGMYLIYGKELETKKEDKTEEVIGTTTDSGFTVQKLDCEFTGDWISDSAWGDIIFELNEDKVTGIYTHDSGKISATLKGNIIIGTWSEAPSYKPPKDAGDLEFEISLDCKTFTGHWRYGSDGSWNGWTGTKK